MDLVVQIFRGLCVCFFLKKIESHRRPKVNSLYKLLSLSIKFRIVKLHLLKPSKQDTDNNNIL